MKWIVMCILQVVLLVLWYTVPSLGVLPWWVVFLPAILWASIWTVAMACYLVWIGGVVWWSTK